jgi:uncharacterized membrane protein
MPLHSDFFFCISAVVLGLVAGMRSMMAPAALAFILTRRPEVAPAAIPVHWFTLRPLAIVFGLLTVGELVADKLPMTPNRIALGPFLGRIVGGSLTGAAFVQVGGINPWIGAACGAVGAVASTFGVFHLRKFVGRVTGISDPFVGTMEDIVAVALAVSVVAALAA